MRGSRLSARVTTAALVGLALSAPVPPADAAPRPQISQRTWIDLKITPMNASPVEGTSPEQLLLKVDPLDGGETTFTLAWPDPQSATRLTLRAVQSPPSGTMEHAVDLEAELTLSAGRTVRSHRRIELDDQATALYEVYRQGDRPLTLVIEAEASQETVIARHPHVGAPVRFLLEIQRVEQGKVISLETNQLQAFEGQSVFYEFQLGDSPDAEAARVSLNPLRVNGSIVEIEVETGGKLPGEGGLMVIGRRERWVASRGSTSTLAFESGDPPNGYRFLVTPFF